VRATDRPLEEPCGCRPPRSWGLVAFACGSDKKDVVPPPSRHPRSPARGRGIESRTYSVSGADSCEASAARTRADVVLCSYDPGAGKDPIGLVCDIEQTGDQVTVTCEGSLDLFPCHLDYHFAGSGTVTDTPWT